MRASCLQESLAKGLALASRPVTTRASLPILSTVLLEARNKRLRLAATNRSLAISCWIGAVVEDEGAITAPARLLGALIDNLPAERIDLALTARTTTLSLRCGEFEANLRGLDPYDFPAIPTAVRFSESDHSIAVGESAPLDVALPLLRRMIEHVTFAAAADESRPALAGVEMHYSAGHLTLTACDNHRLSLYSAPLQDAGAAPATLLIPARHLNELARLCADADPAYPVRIYLAPARNQVLFQLQGRDPTAREAIHQIELVSDLIDARYPAYQETLPKTWTTRAVMDTAALLRAARIADLFAATESHSIQLGFIPAATPAAGQVRLTAQNRDVGAHTNRLPAHVEGRALDIALNARYLIDILNRIDHPQVVFEMTEATRPCLIRPNEQSEGDFVHLMMPMYIR